MAVRLLTRALAVSLFLSSSSVPAGSTTASAFRCYCAFPSRTRPAFVGIRGGDRGSATTRTNMVSSSAATDATETPPTTPKYDALLEELDGVAQLARAASVLEYDKMVFMPSTTAASEQRGKQLAALAAVRHQKATDPATLGTLLREAEEEQAASSMSSSASLAEIRRVRNVALARIEYDKKTCLSKELASREASLKAEAYAAWAKAREADDYSQFGECLGRGIDLAIEIAECKRSKLDPTGKKSAYETMLDEYEPGTSPERIDAVFDEIKAALVPLIARVLGDEATPPSKGPLEGRTFDVDAQKEMGLEIVKAIGFDDANGRIDVSVHPFTMALHPDDVRITSRFTEDDWYQGLAGTIHEGGHAIYEQNLSSGSGSAAASSEPIDEALSMGMHESQSLFWERHIGLSKSFWKYAAPIVNEKLKMEHSADEYYGAVNAVSRSFIRVEADELTYPLHVVLRYEIERDFVQGKLAVEDIPQRWNEDFERLLGLKVPSDAKGCLQDIHWSMLAYGYFPTYLIGSATAAQLAHYCRVAIPDMDDQIERGEFGEIKAWLTDKVHRHGKRYESLDEHLENELGEKLNPKYFVEYLTNKYTELYKV